MLWQILPWMLWHFAFSCRQPAMVCLCDGCYSRLLSLADRQPGFISVLDVMAEFVSCRQAARVYLCVGCYGRVCLLQTGSQGLSLCWMLWQSLSLADRQPGFISVMDVMADCHGCYGRLCLLLQTASQGLSLWWMLWQTLPSVLWQTLPWMLWQRFVSCRQPGSICDGRLCHGCYGRLCLLLQTSWQQTDNWPVRWSMTCACLNISRQRALNRSRRLLALLTLLR